MTQDQRCDKLLDGHRSRRRGREVLRAKREGAAGHRLGATGCAVRSLSHWIERCGSGRLGRGNEQRGGLVERYRLVAQVDERVPDALDKKRVLRRTLVPLASDPGVEPGAHLESNAAVQGREELRVRDDTLRLPHGLRQGVARTHTLAAHGWPLPRRLIGRMGRKNGLIGPMMRPPRVLGVTMHAGLGAAAGDVVVGYAMVKCGGASLCLARLIHVHRLVFTLLAPISQDIPILANSPLPRRTWSRR